MKRRLKIWEKFIAEFKPFIVEHNIRGTYYIKYNDVYLDITSEMIRLFGSEIEVIKIHTSGISYTYTHRGENWNWHEICFEPEYEEIEFLTEEEMEV